MVLAKNDAGAGYRANLGRPDVPMLRNLGFLLRDLWTMSLVAFAYK